MGGFVIFHVYGGNFKPKVSWKAFRQFMLARLARLYSLHLVPDYPVLAAQAQQMKGFQPDDVQRVLGACRHWKACSAAPK